MKLSQLSLFKDKFHRVAGLCLLLSSAALTGCDKDTPSSPSEIVYNNQKLTDDYPVLDVTNYLGNSQNTHCKVLYFDNKWNGYSYWMAYTPYPNAHDIYENPCIAVSNDGYEWTVPEGLENPLDPRPEYGYNSDTHLLHNPETDELEIWWRDVQRVSEGSKDSFRRRISKDGIKWTEEEIVLDYEVPQHFRLSPSVFIEDGRYVCYYSDSKTVYVIKSNTGEKPLQWSEPEEIPIPLGYLRCWHLDVIPTSQSGVHEMLLACYYKGGRVQEQDLYYSLYDSNLHTASKPELSLGRDYNPHSKFTWLYRSSLVKIKDHYRIYFSSYDINKIRYLSVIEGPAPTSMIGWKAISGENHD